MNLFINREGPVPIHDQLCAQISQQVAAGTLAPGQRLPSIRALAQRTTLHHNTILAAYQTLEARGLLVIKEGSGARVADHAALAAGPAVNGLAREFVLRARELGLGDLEIRAACERALVPEPIGRLVVVNPHPDLQDLYMHELAQHFDFPLEAMTPEEVAALSPAARADACFLTSTNFAAKIAPLVSETRPPVLFQLATTDDLLATARDLPPDAVVAVISDSPRFRFLRHELLAGARGDATLLTAALEDEADLVSALRSATLVVVDARVHDHVVKRTRARVYRTPLLADAFFTALAPLLPPSAQRSAYRPDEA